MDIPEHISISLVGIAGAGKSTLAPLLARALGWPYLDTDRLMEAHFGQKLQDVYATMGREGFLGCEERMVSRVAAQRMVVSTGGSVVYSELAVARLRLLGPVVWLRVGLDTFLARVGQAGDRGFVRGEAQSLEDVYAERQPLYAQAADLVVDTDATPPQQCVERIVSWLEHWRP